MSNRLTGEQVLDKLYEYIGIRTCFSESFMQVDVNSFENFNTLIDHMNSNNLPVSTRFQRRKHAKLDKNQIQFLRI